MTGYEAVMDASLSKAFKSEYVAQPLKIIHNLAL